MNFDLFGIWTFYGDRYNDLFILDYIQSFYIPEPRNKHEPILKNIEHDSPFSDFSLQNSHKWNRKHDFFFERNLLEAKHP